MLVTPQRQVLAFGCNEKLSGNFDALFVRGSDLEDYADWTTTSTNNAFEHIDGPGSIVTARMVGNYKPCQGPKRPWAGRQCGLSCEAVRLCLLHNPADVMSKV
jgi:hypothetical protein